MDLMSLETVSFIVSGKVPNKQTRTLRLQKNRETKLASVESIRPGVIGAGHLSDVAFRLQADPRAAVAADIEMGVDGVAVSAYHDDLFSRNSEQEIVALVGGCD